MLASKVGLPTLSFILLAAPSQAHAQWLDAACVADYGCGDSGGLAPPSLLCLKAPRCYSVINCSTID